MKASAIVDWLTFTIWPVLPAGASGLPSGYIHKRAIEQRLSQLGLTPQWGQPVKVSRKPYNLFVRLEPAGLLMMRDLDGSGEIADYSDLSEKTVGRGKNYTGPVMYATVELSGKDCAKYDIKTLQKMAGQANNVTRVDIAVDIETDTMPGEFVAAGYNKKFKTRSSMISETGETEYIGSHRSDRFCRVYKYTGADHPRSGLLRLEFSLKGEYAKKTVERLKHMPVDPVARGLIEAFEFGHGEVQPYMRGLTSRVRIEAKTHDSLSRFNWLMKQVRPALFELSQDELRAFLAGVALPGDLLAPF